MKQNKILIIVIAVLVVLGCVLAAGCTSTENTTDAGDKIAGTWTYTAELDGSTIQHVLVIRPGGTAAEYLLYNGEYILSNIVSWQKFETSDGVVYNISRSDNTVSTFTYNSRLDTLLCNDGGSYTRIDDARLDSIVGSWICTDIYEDLPITQIQVFKWDGTGMDVTRKVNGDTIMFPFTWEKNGDGYKAMYRDGSAATFTLDSENHGVRYSDDEGIYKDTLYVDIDYIGMDPVIGSWSGCEKSGSTEINYLNVFKADGTGIEYEYTGDYRIVKYLYVWEGNGTVYKMKYNDSELITGTIDEKGETFTFADGIVLKKASA